MLNTVLTQDGTQWLQAGCLMTMFGLAWAVAAGLFRHLRMPWGLMVATNLLGGAGMVMAGLRGVLPFVPTHTLPNLLHLACFGVLWVAASDIAGQRVPTREPLATVLAAAVSVLWLGDGPAADAQREATTAIVGAWMALRGGWLVVRRLWSVGGTGVGWAVVLCNGSAALVLLVRAATVLAAPEEAGVDAAAQAETWQARVFFVGVFWINVIMAYGAFGHLARQVHRLQQRDELTGLPDQATVMRALAFEFSRFQRRHRPLGLMSLSIDQLPGIAASAGETTADAVVAEMALELRTLLRPGDVLGHVGGGVFLAVLPDTHEGLAQRIARTVANAVAAQPALHPDGGQALTLSIGVAAGRVADASAEALLARAQMQRWCAHHAGGNQAVAVGLLRMGA